ncbi:DNA primase [Nocardioides sp. S5]|nr:DNA primase [Nocardioides sp. S5]
MATRPPSAALGNVTMTLKKLAAGSGYEYLTRQVAAADSTELGSTPLGDYYSAKGEAPGHWVGSGLVGLDGLAYGDTVTADHMKNLFGEGCHPVTGTALGRAYRPDAVAGFDLTFSPVKSVSTLWAVAPPEVAEAITRAHDAAVADALAFLEGHAIFTREGTDGVRQVEACGLVAAAFVHRDSRAGDPDLHTHVAVANKVQTRQGKWLSVYGTVLHQYAVAASEAYNTALEHHLAEQLGVRFVDRAAGLAKRPVREIDGVDPTLCRRWSHRRHDIEDRTGELTDEFAAKHGRLPTPKEEIALAQRANLETRAAKHEPRSEADQRTTWRSEAVQELGRRGLDMMIGAALNPTTSAPQRADEQWLREATARAIAELEAHRATWQSWHLYAEAQRQVRGIDVPADQVPEIVECLVETATTSLVNLTPDRDPIAEPAGLQRSDGTSVYRHTGADHFTSERMLAAEQRIVDAAAIQCVEVIDSLDVELALMKAEVDGTALNAGQRELVRALLSDPHHVVLALAPAGSGKTTAMNTFAIISADLGYEAVGLAPSAAAAAVLAEATGMATETLAKLDHAFHSDQEVRIGPRTVVVIDEAGMADTLTLDRVIAACAQRGARVRLIGDDRQLAAVGAGGVLRDLATTHGAVRLEEVVRFDDPAEAAASLDLRTGDRAALGFYLDHDRVHTGDTDTSLADVLAAWSREQSAGRECLMLAPTRDLVARLNHAARKSRLAGLRPPGEVELTDENQASVGDTILTRHNDRRLGISATDWVKNGDRWTVTGVAGDGSIRACHLRTGLQVVLPAEYVAAHVELGYATTVHAAQGSTADVMHGIVTGSEDRQLLYTMLTRGRAENHLHLITDQAASDRDDEQFLPGIDEQLTAAATLDRVVDRDGSAVSATTELANATSAATQLRDAARRYADAVTMATTRLLGHDAADELASTAGPLPWLPGVPDELKAYGDWSAYLESRADRVASLGDQVRRCADLPESLARFDDVLTLDLRAEVVVWRAANGVFDNDRSLLGPRVSDPAAHFYARRLQRRINDLYPPSVQGWEERIAKSIGRPELRGTHVLDLARELDGFDRAGMNAGLLLRRATSMRKPLPDEHTVEALAYRVQQMATQQRRVDDSQQRRAPTRPAAGLGL